MRTTGLPTTARVSTISTLDRVLVTPQGKASVELNLLSGLYYALKLRRAEQTFSVATLRGESLIECSGTSMDVDERVQDMLYVLDQIIIEVHELAVNVTLTGLSTLTSNQRQDNGQEADATNEEPEQRPRDNRNDRRPQQQHSRQGSRNGGDRNPRGN